MIIIGGAGFCGLMVLYKLLDNDFDAIVLESNKRPSKIDPTREVVIPDIVLSRIIDYFDIYPESHIFDTVQVRGNTGKIIFEYDFPFSVINYQSFIEELSRKYEESILWSHEIIDFKIEKKAITKLRIKGSKNEILHPTQYIECIGQQRLLARKIIDIENYQLSRQNCYTFFHAIIEPSRHNLEYDILNIMISDYITPGGFSIIYFDYSKRLHIIGFYNKYLSSGTPTSKIRLIRNLLGILGRSLVIESQPITLGRAFLNISPLKNALVLGRSSFIVHPIFYSGIMANFFSTSKLTEILVDFLNADEEFQFNYNKIYWRDIFPYTQINEIIRLFILLARSKTLIESISILTNILVKLLIKSHPDISLLEIALSNIELKSKASTLFSIFRNLSHFFTKFPENHEESLIWIRNFSTKYTTELNNLLPKQLLELEKIES